MTPMTPMTPSEHDRTGIDERGTGAREVLERFRRASIARSADDMSRLYAADAVHEFPFTPPGVPSRLEGRDEIVTWMTEGWKAYPLAYERYRTLAVHDTGDPETIVVEQEAIGTSPSTGAFALPNIVVLTVRDGRIVRLRDYADVLAVSAALGGDL
ncbi:nuclear transport factor 2 family protein [Streptosporangium sp. NPDC050855]|uniref:nuclear transport factor 2 family protein n=1 Tax=Streptosporangium sp. NPDC050855 TaxID=3366194 RepID=UPI0037B1729C